MLLFVISFIEIWLYSCCNIWDCLFTDIDQINPQAYTLLCSVVWNGRATSAMLTLLFHLYPLLIWDGNWACVCSIFLLMYLILWMMKCTSGSSEHVCGPRSLAWNQYYLCNIATRDIRCKGVILIWWSGFFIIIIATVQLQRIMLWVCWYLR